MYCSALPADTGPHISFAFLNCPLCGDAGASGGGGGGNGGAAQGGVAEGSGDVAGPSDGGRGAAAGPSRAPTRQQKAAAAAAAPAVPDLGGKKANGRGMSAQQSKVYYWDIHVGTWVHHGWGGDSVGLHTGICLCASSAEVAMSSTSTVVWDLNST